MTAEVVQSTEEQSKVRDKKKFDVLNVIGKSMKLPCLLSRVCLTTLLVVYILMQDTNR